MAWGKPAESFNAMRAGYQRSRDLLAAALPCEGFMVLPSEGTYFVCVDLAASGANEADAAFCRRAVKEAQVANIPLSPFYAGTPPSSVIRLCFAKSDAMLDEAARRLGRAREWIGP